jgi:hypothetical protein
VAMILTDSQYKALCILREHGKIRPREFAQAMWPNSPGWRRVSKCGPYGVTRGGGMCIAGGCYLGKLNRKGWTKCEWNGSRHSLSDAGKDVLEEHENENL